MRRILAMIATLVALSACSVTYLPPVAPVSTPDLAATEAAISTAVAATVTAVAEVPTSTPTPTLTPEPTRVPNAAVARGYLLTLADLPDGYSATYSQDDDWLSEFEYALENQDDPFEAVTVSASFELAGFDLDELETKPWMVEESLLWYGSPRMAEAAFALFEVYLDEEMPDLGKDARMQRLDLESLGERHLAYRMTDYTEPKAPVSVHLAVANRGPFVVLLVAGGARNEVSERATLDLFLAAMDRLGP